jgi:D-glycero-D-manno-heptose 1,7-bisphosphate phosphatase
MKPAVFFDRDGTLIYDKNYLDDPDDIEWYDGVFDTLRRLQEEGYEIVIITNQSGVARGMFGEETVKAIHDRMRDELIGEGIRPIGFYYCPFLEDAAVEEYRKDSDLRKPSPGMLIQAGEEHDLDLSNSYMVGDKASDVEAGNRAGCRTILVTTGKSQNLSNRTELDVAPNRIVPAISDVVSCVLGGPSFKSSNKTG